MHEEQNTDISCEKKELTSRACLSYFRPLDHLTSSYLPESLCEKALGAVVSQTPQHDADHSEVDPGFFTTGEQFLILGQSAPGGEPGERSLDDPSPLKNAEPLGSNLFPIHFLSFRNPHPP